MKHDMKHMMNVEMKAVQQLNEDMKTVLHKADDKLEETAKKIDDYFQNISNEVCYKM